MQPPERRHRHQVPLVLAVVAALLAGAAAVWFATHRDQPGAGTTTARFPSPTAVPRVVPPPAVVSNIAALASVAAPPAAAPGRDSEGAPTSYLPRHLTDGSPVTAWRMVGDGTGDVITMTFPTPRTVTGVGLVNGYAKTDPKTGEDRYRQERRITAVQWTLDDGTTLAQSLSPDLRTTQTAAFPAPHLVTTVRLRIDAVTGSDPGYDYTAISEIEVDGS